MKKIIIKLITFYQHFIPPVLNQLLGVKRMCRYTVTCSEYAKTSIERYGVIKGGTLSARRIASCNPLVKPDLKLETGR